MNEPEGVSAIERMLPPPTLVSAWYSNKIGF